MLTPNLTHRGTNLFQTTQLLIYEGLGLKHLTHVYVLRIGNICGMGGICNYHHNT